MAQRINAAAIKTKYAVKLDILANSFYDPHSKCNLFKKTPYYFFDHEPTPAIISGVKGGKLIDLKGNIAVEPSAKASAPTSAAGVDVEALKKQLRKEIESEVRAEMAMAAEEAKAKEVHDEAGTEVKEGDKAKETKAKTSKKDKKEE